MVKVAIAGGTGHTGLHIVEGIVESGKHDIVVLSRKSTHPVLVALGVPIITVSYDDPASLKQALQGVHTVISTISGLTPDAMTVPQLALLDAAAKAGVKRFAPSEFGTRSIPDNPVELYRDKWPVLEAVRRSGLEYTVFEIGIFMNTLASGTPGVGHLPPVKFIFDVEGCRATIPGDGSAHIVYTRVEDVGRFVAASLDLEAWTEVSQIRGDRKTYNEVIKLAEEARGKRLRIRLCYEREARLIGFAGKEFEVTYLSEEQLMKTIAERADKKLDIQKMFAQWWLEVLRDNPAGYEGKNLNELCPQVQPVDIEEFLRKWWSKAE